MKEEKLRLLSKVVMNLKRSDQAYKNYLQDGRKFLHARILKICNQELRELMINNGFLVSETLAEDFLNLIVHYDIWMEKWNDLEQTLKPSLEDPFVFQNSYTFPRDSQLNIEEVYRKLRDELSIENK